MVQLLQRNEDGLKELLLKVAATTYFRASWLRSRLRSRSSRTDHRPTHLVLQGVARPNEASAEAKVPEPVPFTTPGQGDCVFLRTDPRMRRGAFLPLLRAWRRLSDRQREARTFREHL